MPTVPRRPAAQRERDRLQARRLRAAELFAAGVRQAQVARQLGVSAQAVSVWPTRWKEDGTDGLRSRGPRGPGAPAVGCSARYGRAGLLEGAAANGFAEELWTLERIALVIRNMAQARRSRSDMSDEL